MIVRCAKCRDLLAYNKKLSTQVVDRCANGCDAGVSVSAEKTEVVDDCWYTADAKALRKLRERYAEQDKAEADARELQELRAGAEITCWIETDDGWEVGEILGWSNYPISLRNETRLYPNAVVRCEDGSIHGRFAGDIRWEEPKEDDDE